MMMTVVKVYRNYCSLKPSALLFIRKVFHMLPDVVVRRAYKRVCGSVMISPEDALRRRRERQREHRARETPGQRERLVCISVACVIGNYFQH